MADIIQLRGGTAAAWTSANTILANKEVGIETDTKKLKIGDGITAWTSLSYLVTHITAVAVDINGDLILTLSDGNTINAGTLPVLGVVSNYITVGKTGAEYTSIKAAVDDIADNAADNTYVIKVYPGVYDEDPFQMKPYVSILGQGSLYATIIKTTNNNANFITGSHACEIRGLSLEGPTGVGFATTYFGDVLTANKSQPFILWDVAIRTGYYGVYAYSDGINGHDRTKIHCINVVNWYTGVPIDTFIYSKGKANITCFSTMAMSGPVTAVTTGFKAESIATQLAELTMDSCTMYATTTGVRVVGMAGMLAALRMNSCAITNGTNGILAEYGNVTSFGCTISAKVTTKHIDIDANTLMTFGGSADKNKITVANGGHLSASFADLTTDQEGQVIIGELWLGNTLATSIPVREYGLSTYSTGWVSGGVVELDTGLSVSVTAGFGFVNDGTSVRKITWEASTQTFADDTELQYLYVTDTNTFVISAVKPTYTQEIMLAVVDTLAGEVTFLQDHRVPLQQAVPSTAGYLAEVIGPIAVIGGTVTAHDINNTTELSLEAGMFFLSLKQSLFMGGDPISVHTMYRDGSSWVHDPSVYGATAWFPKYDNGTGTLQTTTTGKFVRHLLYINLGATEEFHHLIVSQTLFDSKELAEAGVNPNAPTSQLKYSMRLAAIIMDDTDKIVSIVDQRPRLGQSAAATTSITEHNLMSGKQGGTAGEYYHLSAALLTKLNGIAEGAEVNVQSDWNATSGDEFIANKPTLGTAAAKNVPATGNAADTEVVLGSDTRLDTPGADKQVIYNDNGTPAGDSDLTWDKTNNHLEIGIGTGQGAMCLVANTADEVAEPGELVIYAKSIANRVLPKWIGPSGVDTPFQPFLAFNSVVVASPGTGTSTTTGYICTGAGHTNSGTISQIPLTTGTAKKNAMRMTSFTTSTTAGNVASNRTPDYAAKRAAGFFFSIRFGTGGTLRTDQRAFHGLWASTSAPSNSDPFGTSPARVGVGYELNGTTGNWEILVASGSNSTNIDLGATNFPVNTSGVYELILHCAPGGNIWYRATNIETGFSQTGELTVDLPATTTLLAVYNWVTNNAQASTSTMLLNKWYLESDY